MKSKKRGFNKFTDRFKHAFKGIILFYQMEQNAIFHSIAAVTAIGMGIFFRINTESWLAIILAITLVFAAEIFNTALEKLSDHISPEWNQNIKVIKDLSAASVLIAAIGSIILAAIVFLPHLL